MKGGGVDISLLFSKHTGHDTEYETKLRYKCINLGSVLYNGDYRTDQKIFRTV